MTTTSAGNADPHWPVHRRERWAFANVDGRRCEAVLAYCDQGGWVDPWERCEFDDGSRVHLKWNYGGPGEKIGGRQIRSDDGWYPERKIADLEL